MISVALQGTKNPGSGSNFHRAFVGHPVACLGHSLHLPVLFVDCYHYQCPHYDGRLASLSSKLGDGSIVELAHAIIPKEDANNMAWFLQLCALHGVDFDCALFTDRGHIISAVKKLTSATGLRFNLMYCVQHLKRNVWHKFPILKTFQSETNQDGTREKDDYSKVGTLLEKASKAKDPGQFFNLFIECLKQLIAHAGSESGCTLALNVARYLLAIDPMHWTVMANNADVYCQQRHMNNVVLLLRQLAVAVKLAEWLASEKENDVDRNANESVEQIILFESDVLSDDGFSFSFSDSFQNHRQCPRCNENKNNRAESMGNKHLPVRHLAPPDSLVMLLQKLIEDMRNLLKRLFCSADKSVGLLKRGSHHHNKQLDRTIGTLRFGKDKKGEPFIKVLVCDCCPKSISCKPKAVKESDKCEIHFCCHKSLFTWF